MKNVNNVQKKTKIEPIAPAEQHYAYNRAYQAAGIVSLDWIWRTER